MHAHKQAHGPRDCRARRATDGHGTLRAGERLGPGRLEPLGLHVAAGRYPQASVRRGRGGGALGRAGGSGCEARRSRGDVRRRPGWWSSLRRLSATSDRGPGRSDGPTPQAAGGQKHRCGTPSTTRPWTLSTRPRLAPTPEILLELTRAQTQSGCGAHGAAAPQTKLPTQSPHRILTVRRCGGEVGLRRRSVAAAAPGGRSAAASRHAVKELPVVVVECCG